MRTKKEVFRVPISELIGRLSVQSGMPYLLLDGIVTQRLLNGAKRAGVKYLVGHKVTKVSGADDVLLTTFSDLNIS